MIDCLYFLAEAEDAPSVDLATNNGFIPVDTRTTLSLQASGIAATAQNSLFNIRQAIDTDIPGLKAIAAVSHSDSRFYTDINFSKQQCDSLFETWIEKSCHGFADVVFVASAGANPAGYITCRIAANGTGVIGLVGVSESFQRQGAGAGLINAALVWFVDNNIKTVTVATQGTNTQAVSFYKKSGFTISTQELWLHRWHKE